MFVEPRPVVRPTSEARIVERAPGQHWVVDQSREAHGEWGPFPTVAHAERFAREARERPT